MQREVEAKVQLSSCSELEEIEEKLLRLGAEPEGEALEEDIYYQHPCRDFAETDEALRLRVKKVDSREEVELTYKGPKSVEEGVKAREEVTVAIPPSEVGALKLILERLGFKPVAVVRKRRSYWRLGDLGVTLDEVEELGCFIEVEYMGVSGDAVAAVEEALRLLGVEGKPRITESYLELLLAKRSAEGSGK